LDIFRVFTGDEIREALILRAVAIGCPTGDFLVANVFLSSCSFGDDTNACLTEPLSEAISRSRDSRRSFSKIFYIHLG